MCVTSMESREGYPILAVEGLQGLESWLGTLRPSVKLQLTVPELPGGGSPLISDT